MLPNYPLDISFLDRRIDNIYKSDRIFVTMIRYFSGLAIIIACIGLFGLISFGTEQRRKEIGIRKVLGASAPELAKLLTSKLIVTAVLISFPISYYFMNLWLRSFAFRVDIGFSIFITEGLVIIIIALLTISYRVIRASAENPVISLRNE